jgi:tricorn protease
VDSNIKVVSLVCLISMATVPVAAEEAAHLMRWADVHGDTIVFTYEDDLWLVASSGGDARRITNHPGSERYAKFSPDGSMIAFTAGYDGGTDVYVMDARGGVPTRLTYHPATDRVLGWHPAGDRVLFRSRRAFPGRGEEVYLVSIRGGMPTRLPVDRAGLASLSPDAGSLVYNRISREDRTWKRYQGGMAQDLWLGSLADGDFRRITTWVGTDNYPMWQSDAIYFNSDRADGTLNLHRYDLATGEVTALTSYTDFDVKYPSDGPGAIVYQYGERLWLYDLEGGASRVVDVRLGSDRVPVRPRLEGIGSNHGSFRVMPDGETLLLEARGEILAVPSDETETTNLTRTSGSREKDAVPSPDGTWIALNSDRDGQEDLWLVPADGDGEWRRMTDDGVFNMQPVWSPDGEHLVWSDKELRLNLLTVDTGEVEVIDRALVDDAWERWGIQDYVWSPDGRFIAYSKMEPSLYEAIFIYALETGTTHRITDHIYQDWSPAFSADGRYLYFLSNRTFNPVMGFVDQNHVFLDMALPYVVMLRDEDPSPFSPAATDADEATDGDDEDGDDDTDEEIVVEIDFDGIAHRIVPATDVEPGNYFRLSATDDGFLYLAKTEPEFLKYQAVTDRTRDSLELWSYDIADASAERLMDGIANYHLSADGEKMAYRAGADYGIVDTGKPAKKGDGEVPLDGVKIKVDRRAEFEQIFAEAWRIQRDWFYDPGMHGVDWQAVFDRYRPLVASCGNRSDLTYLIGEMIAELNIGHTYVYGGDYGEQPERVRVGLLGADFETPEGAERHRIAHVIPGLNWETASSERSPLAAPGCGISDGDFLVSIDGAEIGTSDNIFAFLEDKVGRAVTVGYSSTPAADEVSTCIVEPIASERALRQRAWVESNRAKVDEASGGAIGYLYLPAMMENGLIEFARAFYPDYQKRAFIIDERYNGGGFVGDMIIDRLERQLWAFTQPREGIVLRDPERAFHGHLVVLINEDTGSNGEYFAEAIKIKGLATLIGMRTWGGAVGIEPHQDLVDGGGTTPPQFGLFDFEGRWLIEGHGVEPDIEVQNEPGDVLAGRDAQLEAGLVFLAERMASDPMPVPETPPEFPNKAKESIAR